MLSLELQYKNEGEWVSCFNIPNITLPTVSYLGFSAHTGEVSGTSSKTLVPLDLSLFFYIFNLTLDFHDLLSVETKTIYSSTPLNIRPAPPVGEQPVPKKGKARSQPGTKKKGDSFGMALLRVVCVLIIMGVGYFVWTAYRAQQTTSRY
jgi:mannose-binding lectin 2